MRMLYLLMVHDANPQIERLVDRLSTPSDRFLVHIDRKTSPDKVATLRRMLGSKPNVRFLDERIDVRYFGYSMIEAMLLLLRAADAAGDFDYVALLSAHHYPLMSPARLKAYLAARPGKGFLGYRRMKTVANQPLERVEAYWFERKDKSLWRFPPRWFTDRVPYRRPFLPGWIPYSGSQWFCLPPSAARYIVEILRARPEIEAFFRRSFCPDESMLPSIMLNGPLADDIICDNLIHDRWISGNPHPEMLDSSDLEPALKSGKPFARKVDAAMADQIDPFLVDR